MRLEKRKVQRKKMKKKWEKKHGCNSKKDKKKHGLQFQKMDFLYRSLLAGPLALHFQDDL